MRRNGHINFFLRCLQALPASGTAQDANRVTIAYFCLSGLDLLGALEDKTTPEQRQGWIEWIWSLQAPGGGFRGSPYMTTSNPDTSPGHIPSTYTALLCLAILRAPMDRLDVRSLLAFLRSCQGPDGSLSFSPLPRTHIEGDFQSDLRMTYCACAVSSIICDFSAIDVDAARAMIQRCQTWEGGYAARPGLIEAQGGTTYCAVASLNLLAAGAAPLDSLDETLRWLLQRQIGGFQGRPGKLEDVCYSFWCGAALSIQGHPDLLSAASDRAFLLSAQYPFGGFGKEPEDPPDPYHSYLALAALAMHEQSDPPLGLRRLDPAWNVSEDTADRLRGERQRIKM